MTREVELHMPSKLDALKQIPPHVVNVPNRRLSMWLVRLPMLIWLKVLWVMALLVLMVVMMLVLVLTTVEIVSAGSMTGR